MVLEAIKIVVNPKMEEKNPKLFEEEKPFRSNGEPPKKAKNK